jgi:hypothetical protein
MRERLEYMSKTERKIADKLNTLTNIDTFWNDVRKFTKSVHSDRAIELWQAYSEIRFNELITGCEDVRTEIDTVNGKTVIRYYTYDFEMEIFPKEV